MLTSKAVTKKWRQKGSGPWRLPVRLNSEFSKVEKMRHLVDNRTTLTTKVMIVN